MASPDKNGLREELAERIEYRVESVLPSTLDLFVAEFAQTAAFLPLANSLFEESPSRALLSVGLSLLLYSVGKLYEESNQQLIRSG